MRIVLFYSETESFNFFTDQLAEELRVRGHEAFILDYLRPQSEGAHSYKEFAGFAAKKIDAVICFDGLGSREDMLIELWDAHEAVVVNILMDHPLRFHPTFEKHPRRYLLFCCDRDHVTYVREYFGDKVPYVLFMPHVGVAPKENGQIVPYKERRYEILFSATYYQPESMLSQVGKQMSLRFSDGTSMDEFYRFVYQNLKENSGFTTEQAVLYTINQLGWQLSMDAVRTLMNGSVYVDWAIRQYQREQVVKVLAESGIPFYLLGRGWENHPSIHCKNVHRLDDRVAYARTLPVMADAKINLNVMPWFKDGSHDRIPNTLLQHSVPLTDTSRWLEDNFVDGQDIALYDLDHLEELPAIVERLLTDQELAEEIIRNGYEKVLLNLTWGHCAEWVLDGIQAVRAKKLKKNT
ncbi:MAG: glycosyltransferase family 1 protein [Lachnospiraceae bacterium]|nr:glycosyltransferase family 1 protein [Lachnospiraceae bacterium]